MAIDKAVDSTVLDGYFGDIADAIRAKTGDTAQMTPAEMPDEIGAITGEDTLKSAFEDTLTTWTYNGTKNTVGSYEGTILGGETVNMPNVTTLQANAFSNNLKVRTLNLPNVDLTSSMGQRIFSGCSELEHITFGNISSMGNYTFLNCTHLSSVVALDKIQEIGQYAFSGCSSLTSFDFSEVTRISQYAFQNSGLSGSLSLPKCESISTDAFAGSKITHVSAPILVYPGAQFRNCAYLVSVDLPSINSTSNYQFYGCSSLTSFELSHPTTNQYFITPFFGCSSLKTIDVARRNQTSAGGNFGYLADTNGNLASLDTIIIRKTDGVPHLTSAPSAVFSSAAPLVNGTGYIYVPAALVSSYEAATNWSTLAGQFRALEDYTVDGTTTGELDPNKI